MSAQFDKLPSRRRPASLRSTSTTSFTVAYDAAERLQLALYLNVPADAADGVLRAWASQFIRDSGDTDARQLLVAMVRFIRETMHVHRTPCGDHAQTPFDTLLLQSGTDRDFATLMIEAIRPLGYAARIVTDELNRQRLDASVSALPAPTTAPDPHAWVQVYLPGQGWIAFDPTHT